LSGWFVPAAAHASIAGAIDLGPGPLAVELREQSSMGRLTEYRYPPNPKAVDPYLNRGRLSLYRCLLAPAQVDSASCA